MVSVRVFDLDHRRVGVDRLARFRDLPSIRCVGVGHDDYPVTEADPGAVVARTPHFCKAKGLA
jgi:hypothetical protein